MVEKDGSRDLPGIARLSRFDPALDVGNSVAAAAARDNNREYAVVVSTVTPRAACHPFDEMPDLSTMSFHWPDGCGRETPAGEAIARGRIVAAARALNDALDGLKSSKKRALVHCSWGQNRSNAICVAYAVLYRNWEPDAAIAYAQETCCRERRYKFPRPLHNDVFVSILRRLRPSTDGSGADVAVATTRLDSWLARAPKRQKHHEQGNDRAKNEI